MLKKTTIPWFMIAVNAATAFRGASTNSKADTIANTVFITSKSVPKEVSDKRDINYTELQIPGGHAALYKFGSIAARKLSFQIELANFNSDFGVSLQLAQFNRLRRPPVHLSSQTRSIRRSSGANASNVTSSVDTGTSSSKTLDYYLPFEPNPYVLYFNSTGNLTPMFYHVAKCDWVASKPNRLGYPQYAIVSVELIQDEDSTLNKIEEFVALLTGVVSSVSNVVGAMKSLTGSKNKGNPYKADKTRLF